MIVWIVARSSAVKGSRCRELFHVRLEKLANRQIDDTTS